MYKRYLFDWYLLIYLSLDFLGNIFLIYLSLDIFRDLLKFGLFLRYLFDDIKWLPQVCTFLRYLFDFFWVWIYLGTDSSLDFIGHISLSGDLLEFGLSWRSSVSWSGPLTVPLGLLLPQKLQEQKDNLSS